MKLKPAHWGLLIIILIPLLILVYQLRSLSQGNFCPFVSYLSCLQAKKTKSQRGKAFCYRVKSGTEILAPFEADIDRGRISFGEKIEDGPFFEKLTLVDRKSTKKINLFFSGEAPGWFFRIEKGQTLGRVGEELMNWEGEKCNLVLEVL